MCVGHIPFGPSLVVEVDGFRNASAIPVAAVVCREGFLSGAAAFDLRPSLWLGCCQGNVCEQEDEVHVSGGAVSAGSAVPSCLHCDSLPNSILSLLSVSR